MDYEVLRAARLRDPFRPFTLKLRDGRSFNVIEPTTMAITPDVLIVGEDLPHLYRPSEVDDLVYIDELGATPKS